MEEIGTGGKAGGKYSFRLLVMSETFSFNVNASHFAVTLQSAKYDPHFGATNFRMSITKYYLNAIF